MCKMDILKHYGFVVGSQNHHNLASTSIVVVAQDNTNSRLNTINTSTDTESRQITDV